MKLLFDRAIEEAILAADAEAARYKPYTLEDWWRLIDKLAAMPPPSSVPARLPRKLKGLTSR